MSDHSPVILSYIYLETSIYSVESARSDVFSFNLCQTYVALWNVISVDEVVTELGKQNPPHHDPLKWL